MATVNIRRDVEDRFYVSDIAALARSLADTS